MGSCDNCKNDKKTAKCENGKGRVCKDCCISGKGHRCSWFRMCWF